MLHRSLAPYVLGFLLACTGSLALAQHDGHRERHPSPQSEAGQQPAIPSSQARSARVEGDDESAYWLRGLRRLDLSDAQKQSVRRLLDERRETLKGLMEQRHQRYQALQASRDRDWNEKQVRELADAYGKAVAALSFQHQKVMADLKAILTPEQVAQLQKLREERRSRDAKSRMDDKHDAGKHRAGKDDAGKYRQGRERQEKEAR